MFSVATSPVTGDYGADLILYKDQQRIAIQAKCYTGSAAYWQYKKPYQAWRIIAVTVRG
ncbi:MAG: restriction endonuclease [Methylococcales bacterium]